MTRLHFLDPNPSGHPAVLLLHGLGATSVSWTLQLPALTSTGFRSLAPDAPGFGESPYDGRGWNIRHVTATFADLLGELDTGPAHIVGISMGGVIAQQFALDFPHLTHRLVLVNTFAVLRPANLKGWLYFLQRFIVVNTLGLGRQAKLVARRIFPDPQHEFLREMLITIITQSNPRAYRLAMRSLGLFDSRKRLSEIKVPTLVITGQDDTTVDPIRQRLLVDGIPGARQEVIAKAGHAVSVDQPDIFNQVLVKFLQG